MPRGKGLYVDDGSDDGSRRAVDAAEVDEQTPDVDKPVAEPPD